MRTPNGMSRTLVSMLIVGAMAFALAACGGGTTSSTSPGVAGPATVNVSIASAPSYPAGTTFASSTANLSPAIAAPPGNSPAFDNVFVTVTKLALIPSAGSGSPDPDGEMEMPNAPGEEGKSGMSGFVTATLPSPVKIDLRNLSPDNVAMLLNRFSEVPAGAYSKIRVYYDNVVGRPSSGPDMPFHPTAHYHFDVHFVGGHLVIPVTSDPAGGIRFYSVVINLVGLKYHQAGQSGNILLRPQVFAEVVGDPKYIVTGEADRVNHSNGTFIVQAVNDNVHAAYVPGTRWFYVDQRYVGPFPSQGVSGADALQDDAIVDVIGTFQSGVLVAEYVYITFPAVLSDKKVYLGWNFADNTIMLRIANDNLVSLPNGRRDAAYYDNVVDPDYPRLTGAAIDAAIVDNVLITARGYATTSPGGIKAYWISIGGIVGP